MPAFLKNHFQSHKKNKGTLLLLALITGMLLCVFSFIPTVVVSGSMSPKINTGDLVIVKRVHPDQVQPGEVIQFKHKDIIIIHRVIDILEDENGQRFFVTKGDANRRPDREPVFAEQVLGKVKAVLPGAGWPTIWIRNPGYN